MEPLKAVVRGDYVGKVAHALGQIRAPGMTVSLVHGVGYDFDPQLLDPRVSPLLSSDELSRCSEGSPEELRLMKEGNG